MILLLAPTDRQVGVWGMGGHGGMDTLISGTGLIIPITFPGIHGPPSVNLVHQLQ